MRADEKVASLQFFTYLSTNYTESTFGKKELKQLYIQYRINNKDQRFPSPSSMIFCLKEQKLINLHQGRVSIIKKKQNSINKVDEDLEIRQRNGSYRFVCTTCHTEHESKEELEKHQKSLQHIEKTRERDISEKNKGGIEIIPTEEILKKPIVIEREDAKQDNEYTLLLFFVKNTSQTSRKLKSIKIIQKLKHDFVLFYDTKENSKMTWSPIKPDGAVNINIEGGSTQAVKISIETSKFNLGFNVTMVAFQFDDFTIARQLSLDLCDSLAIALAPVAPYQEAPKVPTEELINVIPGVPPPKAAKGDERIRLGQFNVPKGLELNPKGPSGSLGSNNHSLYFSTLLHLEEVAMKIQIRQFDLNDARMVHNKPYLALKVPGLSEKRPSVLYGDHVIATKKGGKKQSYQGYVHKVQLEDVLLMFDPQFHKDYINNEPVDISFCVSRVPIRRMHCALQTLRTPSNILFPDESNLSIASSVSPLTNGLYNKILNEEQVTAVTNIAMSPTTAVPYIIFGPPGTG